LLTRGLTPASSWLRTGVLMSTSGHADATMNITRLNSRAQAEKDVSQLVRFWRRFRRHRMAVVGLGVLALIVLYITVGSLVFTEAYANDTNIRNKWAPPSAEHPMGTDSVGRDIMARTVYGGQLSLAISIFSVAVTVFLGTLLGLVAGYYGGLIDSLITRLAEALFVIPTLFLLLVLSKFISGQFSDVTILGRTVSGSVFVIVIVLGL